MHKIILDITHDEDAENPADWDGSWKPYSFNTRHSNFKHPQELGIQADGSCTHPGIRRKMEVGLAWLLSYYEHGGSTWMLAGGEQWARTPDKQWDACRVAGLLVWEHSPGDMGAKTREERAKDAQDFLDTYNSWCNGQVYFACFTNGEECPHCGHLFDADGFADQLAVGGGLYETDHIVDYVRSELPEDAEIVGVTGDCAFLVEDVDWKQLRRNPFPGHSLVPNVVQTCSEG